MRRALALVVLVLGLGGCSGGHLAGPDAATGALAANGCHWPANLADADGRNACTPARALVSCHDASGDGCGCTSDGELTCSCAAGGAWTCASTCAANQYVVSCGGVGPGPVPDPPAGCTFASAIPAGIAYYCCPCE